MKLTTDQIIARHGLKVWSAGAVTQVESGLVALTSYARREAAVLAFCERYGLETETPDKPEPSVEELIERHKIRLEYNDVTGLWRARVDDTVADGFTAAGAVKEVEARIERSNQQQRDRIAAAVKAAQAKEDAEERARKERLNDMFEAGGYVSAGYVTPAPAKKPAQVIAEAKQAAEKRILEYVKSEADALKNSTGARVTGVSVDVSTLRIMGSHEYAAVGVNSVTLSLD